MSDYESLADSDSDSELPVVPAAAAELAGSILDDRGALPADSSLPLADRRQLADQLWLGALLSQAIHPQTAAQQERRIQRAMAAIRREPSRLLPALNPVRRRLWLLTVASTAALVAFGAFLWTPETGPQTALAAIEQSIEAAAQDVDRVYHIEATLVSGQQMPPIILTTRGAKSFVWEHEVPIGTLRVGSNGKEFWMVPVLGPVMVAPEGSPIEQLLAEKQETSLVLNLTTALEWLRDRYDLTLLADQDVTEAENSRASIRCVHYRGKLRNKADLLLPETMEIWSARGTGVVQRMSLSWPTVLPSSVRHAEVRLHRTPDDLPADWYEHAAHHPPQWKVISAPPGPPALPEERRPEPRPE